MITDMNTQIASVLRDGVDHHEIAGASILVLQDDREILYDEIGYADMEQGRMYGRDTLVRLYSMTKPITATAAMILLERGLLDLQSPVSAYLPGFRKQKVVGKDRLKPLGREVLIKDLLSMTSGIPYTDIENAGGRMMTELFAEIDKKLYTDEALSTNEIANRIGECPLQFQPGDAWMYGASADVLGAVIEVITGMSLGDFFKKEILAPLEMEDTDFYVPEDKMGRLAKVYEPCGEGMREVVTNNLGIRYVQRGKPAFESGGAGLVSTIDDYSRFATMLLHGGSYKTRQILQPDTVAFMTAGSMMPWQQESMARQWESLCGYNYGNLMRVMERPGQAYMRGSVGEYGWDGWLGAYFVNSPVDRMTMLVTLQRLDAGMLPITRKLKNTVWTYLT